MKNLIYILFAAVLLSTITLDVSAGNCSLKSSSQRVCSPLLGNVFFVDPRAKNEADGRSWKTAFSSIQKALQAIENEPKSQGLKRPFTIAVARGRFDNSKKSTRLIGRQGKWLTPFFIIDESHDEISILGGFKTGDNCFEDRNPDPKLTILDGQNDAASISIVRNYEQRAKIVMDGFTLTNFVFGAGEIDGAALHISGGDVELRNIHFLKNRGINGGAVAINKSTVLFINCRFDSNHASGIGGGIAMNNAKASVVNCKFKRNYAFKKGGALAIADTSLNLSDSIFSSNFAQDQGGAIFADYNTAEEPSHYVLDTRITHCQFGRKKWGNYAKNGKAIYAKASKEISQNQIKITLNDCQFSGKSLEGLSVPDTGGLYIETSGPIDLNNSDKIVQ